jgi:hypothetical protein
MDDMKRRKFLTLPQLELRPSVAQPVASRYTDCRNMLLIITMNVVAKGAKDNITLIRIYTAGSSL